MLLLEERSLIKDLQLTFLTVLPRAGSCTQSYYPIFMLAGFQGFDGDFR